MMCRFERSLDTSDKQETSALSRRNWLFAVIGLVGIISLGRSVGGHAPWSQEERLEKWMRHHGAIALGDVPTLSRLGAIYLDNHPDERNFNQLSELLLNKHMSPVAEILREQIIQDWIAHKTAIIDGWVLARTEARICAALHLLEGA
jgi:hypothetical protein